MRLGDPEPFGDLGQVLEESKQEHGSLTFGRRANGERTVSTSSTLSRLASESPKLLLTDRPSSSPAASGPGASNDKGGVGGGGDLGLHYLFPVDSQLAGDLAGRGRTAQPLRQFVAGPIELGPSSFILRGNLHRPSVIAEVSETSPIMVGTANAKTSVPFSATKRFTA